MSQQPFQTEVSQLLQLIVHSLYSHPEIFLRELISNSSDALDKLRYLTLTDDRYKALVGNGIDPPRIDLELDEASKTLTVSDTGIGMNEEDLVSHLGTIARSGTKNFLAQLSGDARKDSNLIGQFGVGFYSVFMVADKVEVASRKAGEEKTWKWTSDGKTGFDIEEASNSEARSSAGTRVLIHFNDDGAQYANGWRLQEIIKKYSNHIAFPIFLTHDKSEWNAEKKESIKTRTTEQVNAASAMWQRPKSELKEDDYKEFYKSITGDWEDPLLWFHTRAEGTLEYTTLFYVPAKAPLDLYQADYKGGRQALRQAGLYHGRFQGSASAVSPLRPRDHRFGESPAQCFARNPAAEQGAHQHQDLERQENPLRAQERRGQRPGEVLEIHRRIQPSAQGGTLRRLCQPGDAARPHSPQIL
jgi:molecular chaperone HtpG